MVYILPALHYLPPTAIRNSNKCNQHLVAFAHLLPYSSWYIGLRSQGPYSHCASPQVLTMNRLASITQSHARLPVLMLHAAQVRHITTSMRTPGLHASKQGEASQVSPLYATGYGPSTYTRTVLPRHS